MRSDSIAVTASVRSCSAANEPRDSRLQAEVLALFDQLRTPFFVTCRFSACRFADREEIIQETFLALLRHLRAGKSRENLPAGCFAWLTTLR